MIYHDLPMKSWLESPILCCYHNYHDLQFFLVLRNDLPIKHVIHHSHVSLPEGSRPRLSRFSRAGSMGLAAAPKAAGGGHREGDPVAAGDGDDSTSKFGMIYY